MHSAHSSLLLRRPRLWFTMNVHSRLSTRFLWRRIVYLVLIFNLLILPGIQYAFQQASAPEAEPRKTTVDRTAQVANIDILPRKLVSYQGQRVSFSAAGTDRLGRTIQGAKVLWSSSDADKLQIDDSGTTTMLHPGLVWVTASTPYVSARVPVLIKPGARRLQTDEEWDLDQSLLREDGAILGAADEAPSELRGLLAAMPDAVVATPPSPAPQSGGGDNGDYLYDELWSEPRNLVGSPPNRVVESTKMGTVLPEGSNFGFAAPLWDLSGRGLPLHLLLRYNSRIWSRHGSAVTFNAVNTWPYLGFSISFGRIVTYGSDPNTKFMLIESDGTRRYLGSGVSWQTNTLQTNDGSHITYVGNATTGGTLYYTNGVKKDVIIVNNRLLVVQVTDPNGNYISISYATQQTPSSCNTGAGFIWKQAISSITDTLGRVIQFNYDDCNNLVSITAPGFGGTAQNPVTTTL